ncbi:MAG: insulinase family protein [Thermoanaerobaculaceae bacterium]|nr:insulinase family protein [Thermoanaerobaculaceae bacterium]MDI9623010.1 pitrilysin family protein [Acidobacteriota bacterium]NLH12171.1 insulinase family protein [Holophagae bacterium]HPW54989.1 pitrilysin family protein [Thermoanaerobaculaceae bacterium]
MTGAPVILHETVPGATAALGVWVRSGSADEPADLAGVTHLLEHLLLRRCGQRTPEAIAELTDSLGGSVDAFTTREVCAVTAHVPAERLEEAAELVLEAVSQPVVRADELELERSVVGAEFDLVQDSPAEVVAELALQACWADHPLARPVLGRREVVERLTVSDLVRFHRARFGSGNQLLVVVAPPGVPLPQALTEAGARGLKAGRVTHLPPAWRPGVLAEERDGIEQMYANLVLPGLPADHPEIYTLGVLHQLLGGGASSRLFREMRDRLGLVYEISTAVYAAAPAGVLEIMFSAPTRQAAACWEVLLGVLAAVGAGAVTEREVELAKQALLAGVVLGAEGAEALMEAHAGEWLARHRRFDAAGVCRELEAITPERVRVLAGETVRLENLAGAVCGPRGGVVLPEDVRRLV